MCMVYIKIFQNFVSFNIPIDKKNFYLASEHSRYSGYSVVFFAKIKRTDNGVFSQTADQPVGRGW